jgi:antirestriction protein ArdC
MASIKDSKALEKFAELMIDKIKQVADDWNKPWICNPIGKAQNAITGRPYSGLNDLMLYFFTEKNNYKLPAYLTFNQAKEIGASVLKGEKGFPIAYWGRYFYEIDDPNKHITPEEYNKLSSEEKKLYKEKYFLKEYNVFNVQQTSISQDKPDIWEKIQKKFDIPALKDESGMFKSAEMDNMLAEQSWLCKINLKESNRAFYRPFVDDITVPLKAQFKDGQSFYATLLHEMAHSTGHDSRLKRDMSGFFGNKEYGKEELVAEFTAALSASALGISTNIREENAKYLKNWLEALNEEPKFILTVLSDVHKASTLINNSVLKEDVSLSEAITNTVEEKVIKPETADITPEETKNLLGLQVGQNYQHGKGKDAKEVQLVNVSMGGVFTFKEVKSGVQFKLEANDKPFRNILPLLAESKTNGKLLFSKNDVPKNEFKRLGIKVSDLSASDLNRLLTGKETKSLSIKHPETGEKTTGSISLVRDKQTNSLSLSINFSQQPGIKTGIKV